MITLSYGNGPGYGFIYHENGTRKDLSATEFSKRIQKLWTLIIFLKLHVNFIFIRFNRQGRSIPRTFSH